MQRLARRIDRRGILQWRFEVRLDTLFARQSRRVTATAINSGASSPLWRWGFPRRDFYEIPFRWSARDGDAEALRRLEIE